jgi:predicted kinase
MSQRVYTTMAARAAVMLRAGHSVVADAVYARPADRAAIEHVAVVTHVPFVGLWLDAPPVVVLRRAAERRSDSSDADACAIQQQLHDAGNQREWHRIDADRSAAQVARAAQVYTSEATQLT